MRTFLCATALLIGLASAPALAASTEEVLAKMDATAPKFTGMTANLTRASHTKVIDDTTTETGTMSLRKAGPRELQFLIEFTKPDVKTVVFRGRKAEIYYPKMKTVEEYDLGKNSDLVSQFLTVGFGTTGNELKANYQVKYAGDEKVGGAAAYKLELIPISPKAKERVSMMELWIAHDELYPLQQRILQASGDYYLFTYANVKLNPPLQEDLFRLQIPKGVKRVTPQK